MNALCGILGEAPAGEAKGIAPMLAALAGYGAHADEWAGGPVAFGCRRRPSEEGGDPPLCFEPGLAVAADVRLDDREALCDALGVPRAARAGLADGTLILRAWRRWGRECPKRLLGDYAFALWDAEQHVLFCARDHIGARPFYYAEIGQGFVFAGAVEGVLAGPGVGGALDEASVAEYLTSTGLLTHTRTFFQAVRKLPPGHTLTVPWDPRQGAVSSRAPVRPERYWRPEDAPRARAASDDAYAEEFLALYTRAVRDRLRGPGPVGVHLSGGLDSSSIAVLAARELRGQGRPAPLAFSWLPPVGEEGPENPAHAREYALIDAVCAREGLQVWHRTPGAADVVAVLRRDGAYPGVHIHVNEEAVQREAQARGVRVVLSGWGGDEGASFNGRGHLQHLLLSGRWMRVVSECRARGMGPRRLLFSCVLPLAFPGLALDIRRLWRGKGLRSRRVLIDPAFRRRLKPRPGALPRYLDVRRSQLWLLQSAHLGARIEGWAASGAKRGIEYRYPLLDRRVVEFALGLPPEQFRRGRWSRWLMRHALRAVLPPEVCWNPDKEDPARFEPLQEAFLGAVPAIREALAARAAPPSRAGYVDMARLLGALDAERLRAGPRGAPMIAPALQFLDW